ncbi:unnamed protein product [Gordionus sp. m RMFG-2023]
MECTETESTKMLHLGAIFSLYASLSRTIEEFENSNFVNVYIASQQDTNVMIPVIKTTIMTETEIKDNDKTLKRLKSMKMPLKMKKRGRYRQSNLSVIGLSRKQRKFSANKSQHNNPLIKNAISSMMLSSSNNIIANKMGFKSQPCNTLAKNAMPDFVVLK